MAMLRDMQMSDLAAVLEIIAATDDDDAEEAEAEFHDEGLDDIYVLAQDHEVIGVSGFRPVPAADNTYWLSWTYLAPQYHGKGLGKQLLQESLSKIRAKAARKIFVKVSDYMDETGKKTYEAAMNLYLAQGFEPTLVSTGYYDTSENQHILSLRLQDNAADNTADIALEIADEKPVIRFNGIMELAETEGSYTFNWEVRTKAGFWEKRNFTIEHLMVGLNAVREQGGRVVFLTFPSNLPLIHQPLQQVGFKYVGQLADYYEDGVHELHFRHDLST